MEELRNNGTDLWWEDSHGAYHGMTREHAIQTLKELFDEFPGGLTEVRAKLAAPVYEVASNSFSVLFDTKEAADCFIASTPASVGGGLFVHERHINKGTK